MDIVLSFVLVAGAIVPERRAAIITTMRRGEALEDMSVFRRARLRKLEQSAAASARRHGTQS